MNHENLPRNIMIIGYYTFWECFKHFGFIRKIWKFIVLIQATHFSGRKSHDPLSYYTDPTLL